MLLLCKDLYRCYTQGDATLHVLSGVNLQLNPGEIVALVGASGSGKSTLLHVVGLLDTPTSGTLVFDNQDVQSLTDAKRSAMRNQSIGFVYQFHHLLPEFTALENVMMPLVIAGEQATSAREKAMQILDRVGLSHRVNHLSTKLSGGEQQRVSIARALVNSPKLLLADEPTGNLDNQTAQLVFDEFLRLIRAQGLCALIATHDLGLANKMDRIVHLTNGILTEQK